MANSLTIRKLDESVQQRLRLRAASNQRSMEAEVREILAQSVAGPATEVPPLTPQQRMRRGIAAVRGLWEPEETTDELMKELRADG